MRRFPWWLVVAFVAVILIFVAIPTAYVIALKQSAKYVTITVDGKESVSKDKGHEYRVYTEDAVYVVSDSLVFWNWRAADRYNKLKQGETYRCLTAGWRIGFFSAFPNLISCEATA